MSGGNYDYFCFKLDNFIEELETKNDPARLAFKGLLVKVSKACYDIEWVDSGDYAEGGELEAIDKALGVDSTHLKMDASLTAIKHTGNVFVEQADVCDITKGGTCG